VLELVEFQTVSLPKDELPAGIGERIWREFGKQVTVEFPSPKTGGRWELTNRGWAGYLPITAELGVRLAPKVPIGNLFRMLEYAYDLKSLRFFKDLTDLAALEDVYSRLAELLARRILDRIRRGLYQAYEPRSGNLAFMRGRLDTTRAITTPWRVALPCQYTERTPDVEDNRLLAWTLERIGRSGIGSGKARASVQKAHRALQGMVSVQPFSGRDCVGRTYTRLNEDYATLHALCRFFLEHTGPSHELGDRSMLPFVVNMDTLFEQFVAAWLRAHLPSELKIRVQETVTVVENSQVSFRIDASIVDRSSNRVLCVLDTKYKSASRIRPDDVAQVVAYAEIKGATEGVLVYPEDLASPASADVGHIRVRTLAFSLDGDLDASGKSVLGMLIQSTNSQFI
jgi:5-methylcytosine-specific restriction enzyme subunit McrC